MDAIVTALLERYAFCQIRGKRDAIVDAVRNGGPRYPAQVAVAIALAVSYALGLQSRLRDVNGPEPEPLPDEAVHILDDSMMTNVPVGLDSTIEETVAVLRAAYRVYPEGLLVAASRRRWQGGGRAGRDWSGRTRTI